MKRIISILIALILALQITQAATIDTTKVYGVTIDATSKLANITTSLSNLCKKPTTRIVFDEWVPATDYLTPVTKIHAVSFIMGELLDSYYMKQYNLQQYTDRTNEYLNLLGDKVDIWEIGNEVNGEWCGTTSSVVAKINAAYDIVKSKNKKAALTLYYNYNCWENSSNEMFRWTVNNISSKMRTGLDYVWVSYYEDDCNGYQPNWQKVMDSLHVLFPNSKIGIGECGTTKSTKKASYINRYYSMKITTPNYVGGYFWWYYRQDCVPYTKDLWKTMNNAFSGKFASDEPLSGLKSETLFKLGDNYPNPFNPSTRISYSIPVESFVTLKIYDNIGREITTLVNGYKDEGEYSVDFRADGFAAGVYYYKLAVGNQSQVKRMILVK